MLLLPHYAATATLLGRAHTTGVLPRAGPGPRMLQQADTFSMASLSQRIAEVQSQPEPEVVRLLMLDAMLPRQRLELAAPANLVRTIVDCQESNTSLVVVASHWPSLHVWSEEDEEWKVEDERLRQPATHGVEVTLTAMGPTNPDGSALFVALTAGRLCEIVHLGADEGSPLCVDGKLGRAASVRWRALDARAPEEQPTPALLDECTALRELVVEWISLVRTRELSGREASPRQIEYLLRELGQMPAAALPSDRALWVAALINPTQPYSWDVGGAEASGLARDVRSAALRAPTAEARVRLVRAVVRDSIARLQSRA